MGGIKAEVNNSDASATSPGTTEGTKNCEGIKVEVIIVVLLHPPKERWKVPKFGGWYNCNILQGHIS